jgi:hypothetical protein
VWNTGGLGLEGVALIRFFAATEWRGGNSREVRATDLQHCDWCGVGSLTMLKCGKCTLVRYCSIDCQKAAQGQHKVVCVPKCNMDDVMGLSVGSFQKVLPRAPTKPSMRKPTRLTILL